MYSTSYRLDDGQVSQIIQTQLFIKSRFLESCVPRRQHFQIVESMDVFFIKLELFEIK